MALLEKAASFMISHATSSYLSVALTVLLLLLPLVVWRVRAYLKSIGPDPFNRDHRRPPQPFISDRVARDKVLKQGFTAKKVPEELDAIVIGSGIGGLTTAALLARVGKKVLVLEQHDQAGGCCHSFMDKGYEFDPGIHYIGEMQCNSLMKFLLDQLSEGQVTWEPLEKEYDTVAIGDLADPKLYPIVAGKEDFKNTLYEKFPDEKQAIDHYFALLERLRKSVPSYASLKLMPKWLAKFLISTGLINLMTEFFKFSKRSLKEVLDELTENKDLKAVLAYNFGDYGNIPKEASFALHGLLANHYLQGGSYPRGGSSEIAFHIIPVIEKPGGKVLVRAKVTQILVDENTKTATGVRVQKSGGDVEISAPLVISDAGFYNTFQSLLPEHLSPFPRVSTMPKGVRNGVGGFSVYIGLKGTKEELGLKAHNIWAFTGNDLDGICEKYLEAGAEEAGTVDIPLMFISFPSTKDPEWEKRHPGKSTATIITFAAYEWFEQWKDERIMHRGDEYEDLKNRIGKRMWEQTCRLFPHLEDKVEFFDVGTPVTNTYYIATPRGEMYGLDHNKDRFGPETTVALRPDSTGIRGLFMTGQDVFSAGLAGALFGGLFCAGAVLNRPVFVDMVRLRNRAGKRPTFERKDAPQNGAVHPDKAG